MLCVPRQIAELLKLFQQRRRNRPSPSPPGPTGPRRATWCSWSPRLVGAADRPQWPVPAGLAGRGGGHTARCRPDIACVSMDRSVRFLLMGDCSRVERLLKDTDLLRDPATELTEKSPHSAPELIDTAYAG